MAKKKAKKEVWEVDFDGVSLNDLIVLEEGAAAFSVGDFKAVRKVRDLLGRLVVNRTPEEIGEIPLGELWECLDAVSGGLKSTIPKPNDTPS